MKKVIIDIAILTKIGMKISVMEISCTLNEKINNNGIIENVRK